MSRPVFVIAVALAIAPATALAGLNRDVPAAMRLVDAGGGAPAPGDAVRGRFLTEVLIGSATVVGVDVLSLGATFAVLVAGDRAPIPHNLYLSGLAATALFATLGGPLLASLAISLLDAHDNGRFWRAFLYSVIPQVGAVAALLLFGAGVGISSQIFESLLQHPFYGLALVVGAFLNLAGVPIMASVGFHHGHGSKAVEPVAASRSRRPPPIFSISNMPSRRSPAVPILAFAF